MEYRQLSCTAVKRSAHDPVTVIVRKIITQYIGVTDTHLYHEIRQTDERT